MTYKHAFTNNTLMQYGSKSTYIYDTPNLALCGVPFCPIGFMLYVVKTLSTRSRARPIQRLHPSVLIGILNADFVNSKYVVNITINALATRNE